jgi:hypothetical protein
VADLTRVVVPVDSTAVLIVGTGGAARQRRAYVGGEPSDQPVLRNDAAVQRLSGVAVSVGGVGLDGATVETTTPIETIAAGTVFRASGVVEVAVRADARSGFNGGGPRGVLAVTVFIERLEPVGNTADLARTTASTGRGRSSGDS